MKHQGFTSPRCKIFVDMTRATNISRDKCVVCKGRLLCGLPACPLLEQISVQCKVELKKDFFGPAPSLFVGWRDYPNVYVGPMSLSFSPEDARMYDDPSLWYGAEYPQIIEYRSRLFRSMERQHVSSSSKLAEKVREISSSVKPVDVEISLKEKPAFSILFSAISQPMGPAGELEKLDIASNASVPKRVNSVMNDEIKADVALSTLYKKGFDVYYLTRLLSAGMLGMGKKMVPTRWSITTVDNILSNNLTERIKTYPTVDEFTVLSNEYLGNRFEILFLPEAWEYEQLEAWVPGTIWTTGEKETRIIGEHETHSGRSDYAIREGGGYYAVRFAICEILEKMRRQAAVLAFRETTSDYYLAVGVWECRENVRHAKTKGSFSTLHEALSDMQSRLKIPLSFWRKKSIMLNQARLGKWV